MDRQIAPVECRLDEGADRAAADLPGPEDVERAHGDGGKAELGVVGVRHVLAGELRDGVRPARLAHRADRRDLPFADVERVLAEDLARRELDHPLDRALRRQRCLERVVGADHVHAHRAHGAREHGVDAGDPGRVDDVRHALRRLGQAGQVEHVALDEVEVGVVAEVGPGERVAMEVVEREHVVRVDEPPRERRPDEAGAAGDQDLLAAQSHAASVAAYPEGHASRRPARHGHRHRRRGAGERVQRDDRPQDHLPGGRVDCARFFTLRCGTRSTGTVPRPAVACSRLRTLGESAFRPTPPDMGCADIWGGPSTARVTGTYLGRRLWVRLRLVNGCEIARWHRVGFLLPPPAAGAS